MDSMDIMEMKEAINARHSVRQYQDRPIDAALAEQLKELIDECNQESGLHVQLIFDDPDCFNSLLAHYGKFKNASNYVALVGSADLADLEERSGYYGERIVLEAQRMGLNTCWVAGTYSKNKCKAKIAADEKLVCVIAIGYGQTQGEAHKNKPVSKVCDVPESEMPDWFKEGLDAVMKAPTAINQQKFHVTLQDGEPVITAKRGPMVNIDLGIVKYHFEVVSGHKCRAEKGK